MSAAMRLAEWKAAAREHRRAKRAELTSEPQGVAYVLLCAVRARLAMEAWAEEDEKERP